MRYSKLDGLRGLLSVIVALNHSFLVLAVPYFADVWHQNLLEFHDVQSKLNQILTALGNGGFAVTLFFVLSGMVMGLSLDKNKQNIISFGLFIIKRGVRLMAPYFGMITFVAVLMRLGLRYSYYPFASSWFHWWMNFEMTFKEYLLNLSLYHIYIGGVTWTLRVILLVSILFPLLYLVSKKINLLLNFAVLVFLTYASFRFLSLPGFRDPRYIFMFYAGLILPRTKSIFERIPQTNITKLFLVAILIFTFLIRYQVGEYVGGVYETFTAFLLIGLLSYNEKFTSFSFLDRTLFQFLGKISFSLYLLHFTFLYLCSKLLFFLLPNFNYPANYLPVHLGLFIVSLLMTIPTSHLMYKYLEKPSIKLSNLIKIG